MPTTEQLRNRLLKKLLELFQLDQPDLDFGFYRIMHAKAQVVKDFLSNDLLDAVTDSFGGVDESQKAELLDAYERAIQTAKEYGVAKPEDAEPVKKAKLALDAIKNTASAEADVYDHLYRFFERYYDDGDFISRRYYTRESSGRAAPFAVPYNGEEVKLHWANADQYYIKSTEYFSNFTFDLGQYKGGRVLNEGQIDIPLNEQRQSPLIVHFRVVEATEGEHGNVKASDANKRFFILHDDNPVTFNDEEELVINFEYRPDPKKTGTDSAWREKRNIETVDSILERLQAMSKEDAEHEKRIKEYRDLLSVPADTESDNKLTVLAKYVNRYTARNTMDYFIHKDLGGFLRRELDFYIKNEVMRLDDIEDADAPVVEEYLSKIKVLRQIAGKLIDFLAQLENFQKKLWLKKKFVIETNYCITIDRVPEELYEQIATNDAQREEWVRLFAIDEIEEDLCTPGFTQPLTVEFLKANDKLVLDTRFFDEQFKAHLLASIDDFDEQCNGLMIHSENFQALNLLQERYREQVNCVYIDPPYNTSDNAFLYKNTYKHSSWLAMMSNGLRVTPTLMTNSSVILGAIDDTEYSNLKTLLVSYFGDQNYIGTIVAEVNPAGQNIRPNVPARSHDYFHIFAKDIDACNMILRRLTPEERNIYKEKDHRGHFYWDNLRRRGGNSRPVDRPKQWFPLYVKGNTVRVPEIIWNESDNKWVEMETPGVGEDIVWPIDPKGINRIWRVNPEGARTRITNGEISVINRSGRQEVSLKSREPEGKKPKTVWAESKYSATSHGTKLLIDILGPGLHFSYPKSIHLITDAVGYWADETALVLDFFAGSGTTGHAVIDLNRKDAGDRKYILVEMGDYFETTLKPRIVKIIYSDTWRNGKPSNHGNGISHCLKYYRLEQYEDTLNNLRQVKNFEKTALPTGLLKEDYMLRYMLDVETQGSQSLLNIDAFADPTSYTLDVKKPGSDEYTTKAVDLIETFNYLIGLHVKHTSVPEIYQATFTRDIDPELPMEQKTRLIIDELVENDDGPYWFRSVEGWVPKDPKNPSNSQQEKVLVIWRKLTDDIEQDNVVLDEWFAQFRKNNPNLGIDTIYVNGSNNIANHRPDEERWRVSLIEEEFMKRMWTLDNN